MNRYLWVLVGMLGMAAGAMAAEQSSPNVNVVEGYWDTLVNVHVEGGAFPVPAIKSSKCITRDDLIPTTTDSRMNCRIVDKAIDGDDVSWRLQCSDDKAVMEGTGKITYRGESYNGEMNLTLSQANGNRSVRMRYFMRGSRARSCEAADLSQE